MNPSDSLRLDEHLARLLAAYDQGIEGGDGQAPTVGVSPFVPPPAPGAAGERPVSSLHGPAANQVSLGDVLPDGENPVSPWVPAAVPPPPVAPGPHRVGRFELRRQLGKGGCGIVFLAFDPKLHREVALKIPRPEMLMSPDARRRLVREALAAAEFDHPNLVPVYETGEIGPVCFIATAFCPGATLGEWLDRQAFPVPVRQAARLVATIAEAVQHAHDRGVLHRDLKPNNVILQATKEDPEQKEPPPGSCPLRGEQFIPRVVDFGLAKLIERGGPSETGTRQILGTPKYMAPEQAQARRDDIGPAADVYALGVILYELLTGRAPYDGETDVEVLRQAIDGNLTPPRHLRADIPRDLEAICLKAMARTPARRYRTAIDLADDLRRFLDGKPTLARPLNKLGRAARWLRRNDQVVALGVLALVASVLLAVWVMSTYHTRQLRTDRDMALREQAERTRWDQQREYARNVRAAYLAWRGGDTRAALDALGTARSIARAGGEEPEFAFGYLARLVGAEQLAIACPAGAVTALAVSHDGARLAAGHADGTVSLWDRVTGGELGSIAAHTGAVTRLAFRSADRLVSAGPGGVRFWEAGPGPLRPAAGPHAEPELPPAALTARYGDAVFTAGDDGVIRVWEAAASPTSSAAPAPVTAIGVYPDGREFLAATTAGGVVSYRGTNTRPVLPDGGPVFAVVRGRRDGPPFALAARDRAAVAYHLLPDGPRELFRIRPPDGAAVTAIDLSGDETRLAVGDDRGRVTIWGVSDRKRIGTVETGRPGPVRRLSISHDGTVVAAPAPGGVGVWAVGEDKPPVVVGGDDGTTFRLFPAGDWLATGGRGAVRVWNSATGYEEYGLFGHVGRVTGLAVSPDGRTLVSGAANGEVKFWDLRTGQELLGVRRHMGPVTAIEFADGGSYLVTAGVQVAGWESRD
jgi:WD40 repeat protein